MPRAFVAVNPSPPALDAVAGLCANLDVPGARWSTREQWHLTLQFLGNHADVDAVADALQALAVAAGAAQLGGGGAFPNPRRGRVLWLGVGDGAALLSQLAAAVGALLAPLGYEAEHRTYHPHLTLARCKVPTDLRQAVNQIGDSPVGGPWPVEEVVVYESTLGPERAQYTPRATITLPR